MRERDGWFRSALWGPEDQELFETKLAHAPPHKRPQYLRIKGLALAHAHDPVARLAARDLFERVIALDDGLHSRTAQAHLAEWWAQHDDPVRAAELYRTAISEQQRLGGGIDGWTALKMAELIVSEQWAESYREALELLERGANDTPLLRDQRWRYLVALARIYARTGQYAEARETASCAVDLLAITQPEFPRHLDVGQIDADAATIDEIRSLTSLA